MHILHFLLTASLATAAPLTSRSLAADTVYQDITNIHTGVLANQAATSAYQGGNIATTLIQGTPVIGTVGAIHIANRKGFLDAQLSPKFDEADTQRIFQHVVDTVGESIPADVQVLISKKPQFASSGLTEVVIASLKLLLNDHDTFSAAVTAKAYMGNPALIAEGTVVVAKIHDAIQNGIDVYSA